MRIKGMQEMRDSDREVNMDLAMARSSESRRDNLKEEEETEKGGWVGGGSIITSEVKPLEVSESLPTSHNL